MSFIPSETINIVFLMFVASYIGFAYFFLQYLKLTNPERKRIRKLNKKVEDILNYKPGFNHPIPEPTNRFDSIEPDNPQEKVIDELSRQKLVYASEDNEWVRRRQIN
tara:strand:+ start:3125 stop:3445 length:321 start_codon:yes stop_codon:yes gene_type:complete